jgi:hypothetical protein
MNMSKRSALAAATFFLLPCLQAAHAQDALPMLYRAKFVCGNSDGTVVGRGRYFTAINVLNGDENPRGDAITIRKKFSIALPGEQSGGHTEFAQDTARLKPGDALEIDCPDIVARARQLCSGPFCKGFVVIESHAELDVVAVYTVADLNTQQATTFHTDRVLPSCPVRTEVVPQQKILFVPPDVGGEGADPDYKGHGPCIDFRLSLEVEDGGRTLAAKYRMHAFECPDDFDKPKHDFTVAKGYDEIPLKVASPRGRILGHDVDTAMRHSYIDTNHAEDAFDFPPPNPVERLVFVGDTEGDEAGLKTRVSITLRQMTLRLESCASPPPDVVIE